MSTARTIIFSVFAGMAVCNVAQAENEPDHNQPVELATFQDAAGPSFFQNLDVSSEIANSRSKHFNGHIRTLIPLSTDVDRHQAFFFAPGATYYNEHMIYNLGLGFRQSGMDDQFFWGVNVFYDNDSKVKNERFSQGFELGVPFVTLSGNIYHTIGKWRVKEDRKWKERSAGGYDARLQMELPFYPQIALSTRYFVWKGRNIDLFGQEKHYYTSPRGFTHGVEYRPVPLLGLSVQRVLERRYHHSNTTVSLNFRYDFGRSLESQTSFSWRAERPSLQEKIFSSVERENVIIAKTRKVTIKQVPLVPPIPVIPPINPPVSSAEENPELIPESVGDIPGSIQLPDSQNEGNYELTGRRLASILQQGNQNYPQDGYHTADEGSSTTSSSYDEISKINLHTDGIPQQVNPNTHCAYRRFFSSDLPDTTDAEYRIDCPMKSHGYSHAITKEQTVQILKGINRKALDQYGNVKFPHRIENQFNRERGMYKQSDPEFISLTNRIAQALEESANTP